MRIITALGVLVLVVGSFLTIFSVLSTFQCAPISYYDGKNFHSVGCGFFPPEPEFASGLIMLATGVVLIMAGLPDRPLILFKEIETIEEEEEALPPN